MASDFHDAVRLRERSPLVSAGAAAVALWGAAALVASLDTVRSRRTVA